MKNRWAGCAKRLAGLMLAAAMTGCASYYVDGSTREVATTQFKKREQPQAVQLLFEFQTKGVTNAQATSLLKKRITEQVQTSGLFSEVVEAPVKNGATLSIVMNNVPMSDDAFSKGFVTGLTFGLAGSQVTDGYVCTASYRGPGDAAGITKKVRHAIHTTMGAASQPGNAQKAGSIEEAVTQMSRQVVSQVLNELSQDPAFQ
ncbi:hypothetical protein G8A07_27585 [Roseateles sp. DAIF2]|uniref:hypothetical protein n=1 Tax=Roseateles sp. DAIF2 TaxID=2714952 RepID=UPI0018A28253|nr:hypothetical protein [Roseateles sp. DAIF2]QPF76324.1 hypothetical protein G8A07_27585 [Roseateles sp. DAIF2]